LVIDGLHIFRLTQPPPESVQNRDGAVPLLKGAPVRPLRHACVRRFRLFGGNPRPSARATRIAIEIVRKQLG